jgi:putative tryptophan/tyrosine transport system substrate-binding protein
VIAECKRGVGIGFGSEARAKREVGFLLLTDIFDGPMAPHLQAVARRTSVVLVRGALGSPIDQSEYARVFAMLAQERADALVVMPAPENVSHLQVIVELAARAKLPTIYHTSEFAEAGGLMAYAIDLADLYRRVAGQVAEILKGAKVSEIPFYQATTFTLVINLKAAKSLGLEVPTSLLARADEVIE